MNRRRPLAPCWNTVRPVRRTTMHRVLRWRRAKALVFSRVKDPVRELLQRWAPQGVGASQRLFWSVADASAAYSFR
jgi:hypothetical protein